MDEDEDLFDEMPSQGFYTSVEELGIKYKNKKELSDKDFNILANQLKFADIIQVNKLWVDYLDLVSTVLEKSVLSEIQIKDVKLSPAIMNTITKILNNNTTIFHLRFEDIVVPESSGDSIKASSVQYVEFVNTPINHNLALPKALATISFQKIKLSIGDCKRIGKLLGEHKTLASVVLIDNGMGSEHVCAFIDGLQRSKSIKMLDIQENFVGAKGLKAIGDYLSTTTKLVSLEIAEFDPEKDGLFHLSNGLKSNTSLTVLSLTTANQNKTDAAWIFKSLRYNCVLQSLSVSFNDAFETKELDQEVLTMIRKNRGLHSFNISEFEQHGPMIKSIKENLAYNSYLTDISLDHQADEELEELLDKNIANQTENAKKFLVCCRSVVLLPLPHELKRHVFEMLCKTCFIPFASISTLADTFLDENSVGIFDPTMWFSEHALSSQCYSYLYAKKEILLKD
ncbi:hypothetical protein HK103_001639 [Boothiomyces macroporosus]|uniref:Uncharacterized protein n=1 Tax=Boothiomyces macroporosus TaxID=261099 RepID=A0AAD5Y0G8_9FUNG|nr:hypothetical protein HK103_001639 [Boothiomyces macroporosus]